MSNAITQFHTQMGIFHQETNLIFHRIKKSISDGGRGVGNSPAMFLVGNAAFRKRFPRVSYRTEVPFMVGGAITFGLITWLHYSSYSKRTPCHHRSNVQHFI